jgi:hypothetical protein
MKTRGCSFSRSFSHAETKTGAAVDREASVRMLKPLPWHRSARTLVRVLDDGAVGWGNGEHAAAGGADVQKGNIRRNRAQAVLELHSRFAAAIEAVAFFRRSV